MGILDNAADGNSSGELARDGASSHGSPWNPEARQQAGEVWQFPPGLVACPQRSRLGCTGEPDSFDHHASIRPQHHPLVRGPSRVARPGRGARPTGVSDKTNELSCPIGAPDPMKIMVACLHHCWRRDDLQTTRSPAPMLHSFSRDNFVRSMRSMRSMGSMERRPIGWGPILRGTQLSVRTFRSLTVARCETEKTNPALCPDVQMSSANTKEVGGDR